MTIPQPPPEMPKMRGRGKENLVGDAGCVTRSSENVHFQISVVHDGHELRRSFMGAKQ